MKNLLILQKIKNNESAVSGGDKLFLWVTDLGGTV